MLRRIGLLIHPQISGMKGGRGVSHEILLYPTMKRNMRSEHFPKW